MEKSIGISICYSLKNVEISVSDWLFWSIPYDWQEAKEVWVGGGGGDKPENFSCYLRRLELTPKP